MSGPSTNPYGKLVPGQPIPGIPAEAWNAFLALLAERRRGGGDAWEPTSAEVQVRNDTGSPLATRFKVLQVGDVLITQAQNDGAFATGKALKGTAPADRKPFAVLWDPLSAGAIGRATLLGLTPVQVNLTDTGHRYAAPAAGDTAKLVSRDRGAARLLWTAGNFAATGVQWAVALLLGDDTETEIGEPIPAGSGSGSGSGSGAGVYADWQVVRWSVTSQTWGVGERIKVRDANA